MTSPGLVIRALAGGLALALIAVTLGGCETSAEKDAALAKQLRRDGLLHPVAAQRGLSITSTSRYVKVLSTALLHDENGTAAVVTLRDEGPKSLREVPLAISLKGHSGQVLFQNNAPGLSASLTSAPLLLPHRAFTWVDDQLPADAYPTTASAQVGEATPGPSAPPSLEIQGVKLVEDPANGTIAQGTLANRSDITQQNLVVFAVARRGGKLVAAGRAILASVAAHASSPFQVFFIGNPGGAQLEVSAPPTTLG